MEGSLSIFICIIISLLILIVDSESNESDRIKFDDIRILTFESGHNTTAKRLLPRSQLICVGGTANCTFVPEKVNCYNFHFIRLSSNWKCEAEMSREYRFGELKVSFRFVSSRFRPRRGEFWIKYSN